jgi:SnoaL-like domain
VRVEKADLQRWLDDYIGAWKTYEENAIRALFSDDATYRWHPWDEGAEAVHGQDAIVAAWLSGRDVPGSWSAEYRPWAIDGDRAVAVGISRYFTADGSVDREYHNVFLCRFDAEGRCRDFTEHFMRRTA